MNDLRKLKLKTVTIATDAGEVTLRELPAGELVGFVGGDADRRQVVFRLLSVCIVNEDGAPYMSEDDVRGLPWSLVLQLSQPVLDLNGMVDVEKKS